MEIIRASIDRFDGDYAVIYSSDRIKFDIPRTMVLGMKTGSNVILYVKDSQVVRVEFDKKSTQAALERITRKYKKLRRKNEHTSAS